MKSEKSTLNLPLMKPTHRKFIHGLCVHYRLYFYFIFIEPGVLKIRPESMLIVELNPIDLKALHNKTKSEVFSLQQYIEALESSYIIKNIHLPPRPSNSVNLQKKNETFITKR